MFTSYRAKLQTAFLALGFTAIGLTGWEASAGAAAGLRQATFDRLTAIRQTRCRQIERYFQDLGNHVLALSADESAIRALEEFRASWGSLPPAPDRSAEEIALRNYYRDVFAPAVRHDPDGPGQAARWFPVDPRVRQLQYRFLAGNPHPVGAKSRLLEVPGPYGRIHARYHPTFHRYLSAFGFYDLFLISADRSRVLYTVFKEIDLGVSLDARPYRDSPLAAVYRDAMALEEPERFAVRDYQPYLPSHLTPAAFLAAPVWRGGAKIGVLAIQVSVDEVNRVMTAASNWREEGLGRTGQAYIVGRDGLLRSDMRHRIEDPELYFAELAQAGVEPAAIDDVRRHGTAVLRLPAAPEAAAYHHADPGTEAGVDARGVPVLRSHAPLRVPGLDWALMAEIDQEEAFAPVRSLRTRIAWIGFAIAAAFLAAAALLARSVTGPVRALAEGAARLGRGDFGARIPVRSSDEIGALAGSFNRMAEDLERTTVSKSELEILAGRLITAQEDERRRVARELHDDITQRMAAVAIEAGIVERLPQSSTAERSAGLARIRQQMADLSNAIHGMSRRLHPALLDDLGLAAAIEAECRATFDRGGPPVELEVHGDPAILPPDVRLAFYRIVQEALRNMRRHAAADSGRIALTVDAAQARLEISDDGRGFDRDGIHWRAGLGLASMEERMRLLGGDFSVQSKPGSGARIVSRAPLDRTA